MQQELTDQQHQAIELLILGNQPSCIAETLEIRRETLWRWRQLPEFQKVYRGCQQQRREEMREQVAQVVSQSLGVITRELTSDSPFRREEQLLTALSIFKTLQPAHCFAETTPMVTGQQIEG